MVKNGNIWFKDAAGKESELTRSGKDSDPCVSQDGRSVVFVRDTPEQKVETGAGEVPATELHLVSVADKKDEVLVKGKSDDDMKKMLGGLFRPHFSPDGRVIYFNSAAWATSGSVQRFSLDSRQVKFVIDGDCEGVIPGGKLAGKLLVVRSLIKHDKKGESMGRDVYLWLVAADGKPVREIGQAEGREAMAFLKAQLGVAGE